MNPREVLNTIATMLRTAGHPDITGVAVGHRTITATTCDGGTVYIQVPHIGPAGDQPERPSWPGITRLAAVGGKAAR